MSSLETASLARLSADITRLSAKLRTTESEQSRTRLQEDILAKADKLIGALKEQLAPLVERDHVAFAERLLAFVEGLENIQGVLYHRFWTVRGSSATPDGGIEFPAAWLHAKGAPVRRLLRSSRASDAFLHTGSLVCALYRECERREAIIKACVLEMNRGLTARREAEIPKHADIWAAEATVKKYVGMGWITSQEAQAALAVFKGLRFRVEGAYAEAMAPDTNFDRCVGRALMALHLACGFGARSGRSIERAAYYSVAIAALHNFHLNAETVRGLKARL